MNDAPKVEMVLKVPAVVLTPLRLYFQVAARAFPGAAVGAFKWLMSNLPRRPLSARDKEFLRTATRLEFPCDGAVLVGYTFGEGPTVLLVHGLLGNAANYHAMIPLLVAEGYRVVAFDSVNHGNSPDGTAFSNRTIRHLGQVIHQVGNLHAIVSHSAGTYLVMMALLDLPAGSAPGKCVYIAPYPDIETTLRTFTDYFRVPNAIYPQLRRWFEEIGNLPLEQQSFRACLPLHPTPAGAARLFVHDSDDRCIPLIRTQEMLAGIDDANLFVTQGLGHFGVLKDVRVVDRIIAFLNQGRDVPV